MQAMQISYLKSADKQFLSLSTHFKMVGFQESCDSHGLHVSRMTCSHDLHGSLASTLSSLLFNINEKQKISSGFSVKEILKV